MKYTVNFAGSPGWISDVAGAHLPPNAISRPYNAKSYRGGFTSMPQPGLLFDGANPAPDTIYGLWRPETGRLYALAGSRLYRANTTNPYWTDISKGGVAYTSVGPTLTPNGIWKTSGFAWGNASALGSGVVFNICSGALAAPQWYDYGAACIDLPNYAAGVPSPPTFLTHFKNHWFALGLLGSGYRGDVWWSHPADDTYPVSWDVTDTTRDAGKVTLLAKNSLYGGTVIGESLFIYGAAGIWQVQYIGGTYIFDFQPVSEAIGGEAGHALVEFLPGRGLLASRNDVYLLESGRFTSIATKKVREMLGSTISWPTLAVSDVLHEVWLCSGSTVLAWDWETDHWHYRVLPGTHYAWAQALHDEGSALGFSWTNSSINLESWGKQGREIISAKTNVPAQHVWTGPPTGGGLYSEISRVDICLPREGSEEPDHSQYKMVTGIWVRASSLNDDSGISCTVELGVQTAPGRAVTWGSPVAFDPLTQDFIPLINTARVFAVRFRFYDNGKRWLFEGYELDYQPGGNF